MLAIGTHIQSFYILRDDLYDPAYQYSLVDIAGVKKTLLQDLLKWKHATRPFWSEHALNDFILMCFMTGNDFLPHIPSIEIISGGIEHILSIYRDVCSEHGHLTYRTSTNKLRFDPKIFGEILKRIGIYERENYILKLKSGKSYHPDKLLERYTTRRGAELYIDIEQYNDAYYLEKFGETSPEKVCHQYIEGVQWVLTYYTEGVPNWKWFYPYHYAPTASMLCQHTATYTHINYTDTTPSMPFQQLLSVLPPASANLLPSSFQYLLTSETSPLKDNCPRTFDIDLSGKRQTWEGIVLLPMVDYDSVRTAYMKHISTLSFRDKARNQFGQSYRFVYTNGNVNKTIIQL